MSNESELLFELFCDWYNVSIPSLRCFKHFTEGDFIKIWKDKWFAKQEQQTYMDSYLKKYSKLFQKNIEDFFLEVPPSYTLVLKISALILWDQVSRNIYRGSALAYETDSKARKLVEDVMMSWDILPLPIRITCILVYIHSEDKNDLQKVDILIEKITEDMSNFPSIFTALKGVAKNHHDRMTMFGRIPERNKYLGRISTDEEHSYLSSF